MTKTDWTKWSAIAEILSAVAILATLGYLALQTRYLATQTEQNTAALLAGNRQAFLEAEIGWLYDYMAGDAMAQDEVWGLTRMENPGNRYDQEVFLDFQGRVNILFRMRETLWLNYANGAVDEEVWEAYRDTFVNILTVSTNARAAWDFYSEILTPGFRDAINSRLD